MESSCDNTLRHGDLSLVSNFGERLISMLQATGETGFENLLPDIETLNGLLDENGGAVEWSPSSSLDVVSQLELDKIELQGEKVTEEEVDKRLKEGLGDQESKACVTHEILGNAQVEHKIAAETLASINRATNFVRGEIEVTNKMIRSLENATKLVSQEKSKSLPSMNTQLKKLTEKTNMFIKNEEQYLNNGGEPREDISEIIMKDKTFLNTFYELLQCKMSGILETVSQQLKEQLCVGSDCALLFTSRVEGLEIENSSDDLTGKLSECQDFLKQFERLQTCINDKIHKNQLCRLMESKILDQIASGNSQIIDQFETITDKSNKELQMEQGNETRNRDITLEKLASLNETLIKQSTLVTPENFLTSLTAFSSEFEKEEENCAQAIELLHIKQRIMLSHIHKLIREIDHAVKRMEEGISNSNKLSAELLKFRQLIDSLKNNSRIKEERAEKEKLKELMILCLSNTELFDKKLQETKEATNLLSKHQHLNIN